MNLAIISTHPIRNHYVYYEAIITLFPQHHITLFLHEAFRPFLEKYQESKQLTFHYNKNSTPFSFLRRHKKTLRQQDTVIMEEPYSMVELLSGILLGFYTSNRHLTIHNVNRWFRPVFTWNPRGAIRYLLRKVMLLGMKKFIVTSPNVLEYVRKTFPEKKEEVHFIPFSVQSAGKRLPKSEKKTIDIVIPGVVDSTVRDYDTVLEAFRMHLQQHPGTQLRLILLGKLGKKEQVILRKIKEIQNIRKEAIVYWDEFIDDQLFNDTLANSDFLVANIRLEFKKDNTIEIYGKTKETGVFFQRMNYGKRLIAVEGYGDLSGEILHYKDHEGLSTFFEQIENGSVGEKVDQGIFDHYSEGVHEEVTKFY